MMKVAVYGQNYVKETTQKAVQQLLNFLLLKNAKVYFESEFIKTQNKAILKNLEVQTFETLDASYDLLISV